MSTKFLDQSKEPRRVEKTLFLPNKILKCEGSRMYSEELELQRTKESHRRMISRRLRQLGMLFYPKDM